MGVDIHGEISALARLAVQLTPASTRAERLDYHRRKAKLLTAIADQRTGDKEAREVAENAWRQVRDLEEAQ